MCWEHALRLPHLRYHTPRSLSLVSLNTSTRSRSNLNPIPTSPTHFPDIQCRVPSPPQHAQPEKVGRQGEGNTNINGSSSDEDDFDGGPDTHMWNHTGVLLRFLSFICASARTSSSSRMPALAVSLTYLLTITLLVSLSGLSPLRHSCAEATSLAITAKVIMTMMTATATTTGDNNGDEATVATTTMGDYTTRQWRWQRGASNNNPDSDNNPNGNDNDN
ncbi:hypothetical protein EDB89DRAFT_1915936 [Lactarius sanguifluus]|nr:hypothetical protein EDB89DRAFT_1915936 [Lactarius sanguifluus]